MMKIYKPKQQKSKMNLIKSFKNKKRPEIKKQMSGPKNQMKRCLTYAIQWKKKQMRKDKRLNKLVKE